MFKVYIYIKGAFMLFETVNQSEIIKKCVLKVYKKCIKWGGKSVY